MKIFLARAKVDYGTLYESNSIEKIKDKIREKFNVDTCSIIPFPNVDEEMTKGKNFFALELNVFFPLILECDIFVVLPIFNEKELPGVGKRGSISTGVMHEIRYAKRNNKTVLIWRDELDDFVEHN